MRQFWSLTTALFLVVGIAFGLRFYHMWDNPPALSWDEVSIGYNAYSILKTGRDEHGKFLPHDAFVSYGDYKPPLAIYLTVPGVAIFGLNEFAVRLPSVLFGTLTVLMTYFLVLELLGRRPFDDKKRRNSIHIDARHVAIVSSLLLAVSPWHINLSRAGFEANIALFFVVFGVWLILSSRTHPWRWSIAWLPFVAGIYTFNSTRYFVPLMGLGLLVYCWKHIVLQKRNFALGVIIALMTMLPILPHLVSKDARLRFDEVNIFTDSSVVQTANNRIASDHHSIVSEIFDNRRIGYARSFLIHYFDHFTADFLFIKGDGNPKFSTQDVGQLYIIDLPFLILGLYFCFAYFRTEMLLLLFWLVTAIIPAATARETPHALRILNSLPTWHIFIAIGIVALYNMFVRQKSKTIYGLLLGIFYLICVSYYLHNYYVHYPKLYSGEWQYGYKQALSFVGPIKNDYKKIYLSESIGRAYMYTLFYTKYDPNTFQKHNTSYFDAAGFYHVDGFDKYVFTSTLPTSLDASSLYIFPSNEVPNGVKIKGTIYLLNGMPELTIFTK